MKTFSVLIIGLVIALAFVGAATAAILPPQTNETQTISSVGTVQCSGIVVTGSNYVNENSNQALDNPPLASKEVYGASTYNSQMVALNGQTTLVKVENYNTKNQVIGGKNIDVTTNLQFEGNNGGFATGSEDINQFVAGAAGTKTESALLCPFNGGSTSVIAPFNEAVTMDSKFDMFYGTVASQASLINAAKTADTGINTQYAINADGSGSISTGMSVFAQDARNDGKTLITPSKTVTVAAVKDKCGHVIIKEHKETIPAVYSAVTPSAVTSYTESTSAIGRFTVNKAYSYTSGIVG